MAETEEARPRDVLLEVLSREGRRLGSASTIHNQACADLVGLNSSDWECLDVLDWTGSITAGHLAEHVGLTSGAITGVIDRLEKAGFVRRASDPADRRKVIVQLIRDRDRELGEAFAHLSRAVEELTGRYSDAELAVIVDFLQGANEALVVSTDRMRAATRARKRFSGQPAPDAPDEPEG